MSKGLFDRLEGELEAREQHLGLKMADLLTLPDPLGCLLNWMVRKRQVSLAEINAFLGQDEAQALCLLAEAQGRGYVREIELREGTRYRVRLSSRRGSELPEDLWQALQDKCESGEAGEP